VRVQKITAPGTFRTVVPRLGVQAIGIDATSILNNRMLEDPVTAGELLKIVQGGAPR
jgi:hypothetical protein